MPTKLTWDNIHHGLTRCKLPVRSTGTRHTPTAYAVGIGVRRRRTGDSKAHASRFEGIYRRAGICSSSATLKGFLAGIQKRRGYDGELLHHTPSSLLNSLSALFVSPLPPSSAHSTSSTSTSSTVPGLRYPIYPHNSPTT